MSGSSLNSTGAKRCCSLAILQRISKFPELLLSLKQSDIMISATDAEDTALIIRRSLKERSAYCKQKNG